MELSTAHPVDPRSLRNTLSDGSSTCSYADLESVFAAIDSSLEEFGVRAVDWLAFECPNTVPGAAALLYLLDRRRSFVLLPPRSPRAELKPDSPAVPSFCRFALIPRGAGDHPSAGWSFETAPLASVQGSGPIAPQGGMVCVVTSGSTATPKLAAFETSKLIGNALACVERLRLHCSDRVIIPAPIFHMFGLGVAFLPAVACRASVDLMQDANVLKFLAREKAFQPNVAFFTPNFCESLLRIRKSHRHYRFTASGGDKLSPALHEQFEERFGTLVRVYGSTELGVVAAGSPDDPVEFRRTTIGRLVPGVRFCAVGANDTSRGSGEGLRRLGFHHPWAFSGYLDSTGEWVYRYDPDECYDMHDVGRFHAGEYLEVLGRTDHQVKRDGELVAFADVEMALVAIPGVSQAAVFSDGRCARGDTLVACCVPDSAQSIDERTIRAACRSRMPAYAVPDRVVFTAELPLLDSGKVDRAALRLDFGSAAAEPDVAADREEAAPDGNS